MSGVEVRTLRELRRAKSLTLRQLAETLDISVPRLSKIERGLERPSWELLKFMAEELDFDPVPRGAVVYRHHEAMSIQMEDMRQRLVNVAVACNRLEGYPDLSRERQIELVQAIRRFTGIESDFFRAAATTEQETEK